MRVATTVQATLVHLRSLKDIVQPFLALSENVPGGNINLRIVEALEEDYDSKVQLVLSHLHMQINIYTDGIRWVDIIILDVDTNCRYIYICLHSIADRQVDYIFTSCNMSPQLATLQVIFGEPSDLGFTCVARTRAFTVLVRRSEGRFILDPQKVYHYLCRGMADKDLTMTQLHGVAQPADLARELALSGKSVDNYPGSFLGSWEQGNLEQYRLKMGNENLESQACCLNQNPQKVAKMTKNGVLPTFTKADKLTWLPGQNRHLLAQEKYAAHSFGVTQELAAILKTPAP